MTSAVRGPIGPPVRTVGQQLHSGWNILSTNPVGLWRKNADGSVTDVIGESIVLPSRIPSNSHPTVQQVKGTVAAFNGTLSGSLENAAGEAVTITLQGDFILQWSRQTSINNRIVFGLAAAVTDYVLLNSGGYITVKIGGAGFNFTTISTLAKFYRISRVGSNITVETELATEIKTANTSNFIFNTIGKNSVIAPITAQLYDFIAGDFTGENGAFVKKLDIAMVCAGSLVEFSADPTIDVHCAWKDTSASPITEVSGYGSDRVNTDGFSTRENLLVPSGTFGGNYSGGNGWVFENVSGNATRDVDTYHLEVEGDRTKFRWGSPAVIGERYIVGLNFGDQSGQYASIVSYYGASNWGYLECSGWKYFVVYPTVDNAVPWTALCGIALGRNTDVTILDAFVTKLNTSTAISGTFVFLGDSITANTNIPEYFSKLFNTSNVVNSGVAGDTIADMIARFSTDVAAHSPDYVHLLLGINDILDGRTLQQMKDDYTSLETLISGIGAEIILSLNTPFGGYAFWTQALQDQFDQWIDWLKTKTTLKTIDLYNLLLDSTNPYEIIQGFTSDKLHPLVQCGSMIASAIAEEVGIEYPGYVETKTLQITGRQPAGFQGNTDNSGPLRNDMIVTAGDTYPNVTVTAPLGPVFQAIPEWANGAAVDLSTFVNTAQSRFGARGGVIYSAEQDAATIIKIDRVID